MNRPRNRQPRSGGQNDRGSGSGRRGGARGGRRPEHHPVPATNQVIAGASVSIVLKQDQGSGREVQGIVQDILTSGDHPRGIKVRLRDGRVGRVQRMHDGSTPNTESSSSTRRSEDYHQQEPPPRTLANFLPEAQQPQSREQEFRFTTATAKCPICGSFEGDVVAVSHHVEMHLT